MEETNMFKRLLIATHILRDQNENPQGGGTQLDQIASMLGARGDNPTASPTATKPAATDQNQPAFVLPEKFKDKSPEDIVKAYLELESQVGQINTQLEPLRVQASKAEQLEGIIAQLMTGTGQQPNQQQEDDVIDEETAMAIFKDPKKVLAAMHRKAVEDAKNGIREDFHREAEITRRKAEVKDTFYKSNPDLAGKEILVGAIARNVQAANPGVSPLRLLDQIAAISRSELAKLTGIAPSTDTSLHVDGGNARPSNQPALNSNQKHIFSLLKSRR